MADHSVRKLIVILITLSLPLGITYAAYPRKPDAHPHPRSSFQTVLELFCSLKNNSFDHFILELLTLENWTKRTHYHLDTMNCSSSDDHAQE